MRILSKAARAILGANNWRWLEYATQKLRILSSVLYTNLYSIFLLLFLYVFYWQFGQAKDLLITLNQESTWDIALFFISLVTLATLCWYIPKFLYRENREQLELSEEEIEGYSWIARLFCFPFFVNLWKMKFGHDQLILAEEFAKYVEHQLAMTVKECWIWEDLKTTSTRKAQDKLIHFLQDDELKKYHVIDHLSLTKDQVVEYLAYSGYRRRDLLKMDPVLNFHWGHLDDEALDGEEKLDQHPRFTRLLIKACLIEFIKGKERGGAGFMNYLPGRLQETIIASFTSFRAERKAIYDYMIPEDFDLDQFASSCTHELIQQKEDVQLQYFDPANFQSFHTALSNFLTRKIFRVRPTFSGETPMASIEKNHLNAFIPRVFGFMVLLIVAFSIMNVRVEQKDADFWIPISANLPIVLSVVLFFVLLLAGFGRYSILRFIQTRVKLREHSSKFTWIPFVILVVIAAALFILARRNSEEYSSLNHLMWAGIMLALAFFIFTLYRKGLRVGDAVIKASLALLTAFLMGYFIMLNCDPLRSKSLNPLICTHLAFIFYFVLFSVARIYGARRRTQLVTIGLIALFALSALSRWMSQGNTGFYGLDYIDHNKDSGDYYDPGQRVDLYTYADHWIEAREGYIQNYLNHSGDGSYPVFIISSEGGGSMAAYWVNLMLDSIQSLNPDFYDNHIFAFTGASGGMTGNSLFFLMNETDVAEDELHEHARNVLGQNYLSPAIVRLLGFDFWRSAWGVNLGDNRSEILEKQWTSEFAKSTGRGHEGSILSFRDPILKFWYDSTMRLKEAVPPLMIYNTFHVQEGAQTYFSPVRLDSAEFAPEGDMMKRIQYLAQLENEDLIRNVRLSTANVLNASFPYVNNTGFVDKFGNFADAGYYDNFGSQTSARLVRSLKKYIARDSIKNQVRFISLVVQNSSYNPNDEKIINQKKEEIENPGTVSNIQVLAPLSGITNIYGSLYFYNWGLLSREWNYGKDNVIVLSSIDASIVVRKDDGSLDTITPQLPAARYLSDIAMDAMVASRDLLFSHPSGKVDTILSLMKVDGGR